MLLPIPDPEYVVLGVAVPCTPAHGVGGRPPAGCSGRDEGYSYAWPWMPMRWKDGARNGCADAVGSTIPGVRYRLHLDQRVLLQFVVEVPLG